ncbi:MAG: outer membrane beta-barrel family protein, partial [Bacteroidota bacterium]
YEQRVLGAYATGAYEVAKWGIKAGMRVENTILNTFLVNTRESNRLNFTNLFPSFHSSYKFSETFSVQAGYSRRIRRPRLWDLNPFFNIRNNFSIRTGNPDLLPEFTDSYEINSIFAIKKGSFNLGLYHRYTTDVIERVTTFEDDVAFTQPRNIGTNKTYGIEVNGKYRLTEWFSVRGDANFLFFYREGSLDAQSFDFEGDQWTARMTTKFKLPASIDFELTGNYESAYRTVQGEVAQVPFLDLGLRKKILKGKLVTSFSIRDVFASRIQETEAFQPNFYFFNRRFRGRFITLGVSYGFGKGEAMEYSGRRR